MIENFPQALTAGVERLTAWADFLDRINVFPIADGDTGRNLVISLSPLRHPDRDIQVIERDLLLSARGNSGNIAAPFFSCFILAGSREDLPEAVRRGRDRARLAVPDPQPGTMLSFFDALAEIFSDGELIAQVDRMTEGLAHLEEQVRQTTDRQPRLREAGVVDAGAMGMLLYFEGFFHVLSSGRTLFRPVTETFMDSLHVLPSFHEDRQTGYCVDTVLKIAAEPGAADPVLSSLGESVVIARSDIYTKVHFHTQDREEARQKLTRLGQVVGWEEDNLQHQTGEFGKATGKSVIHIMTDAAGSLNRQEARDLGISLLDSYITVGEHCLPETYVNPHNLYHAMRSGVPVTTAQASVFERRQTYASIMSRHARALYLCVGSAFTGNYGAVMDWKKASDPDDRLDVLDTGAASGRLGVLVLAVAAYATKASEAEHVIAFARQAIGRCEEYVFLDRLEYLAAGGRLSKAGAFFGDMLRMKPIVSPTASGVKKVGVARNREEQLRFALEGLDRSLQRESNALIMLEYSDNRPWVEEVRQEVMKRYQKARILVHALSLTSGTHMGPETWAIAFLRE